MTATTTASPGDTRPLDFSEVLECEQREVGCRAPGESVGLAFSGGGIRSATFNLGVIQALAERGWLRKFDYLSTVSGGGYIGSWLTTLISRHAAGDAARAEQVLQERDGVLEPGFIRFLRAFSNYLTPSVGLSGDGLTAVATYLRNLLLNLSVLATLLVAFLILPRLSVGLGVSVLDYTALKTVFSFAMFILLVPSIATVVRNLFYLPEIGPREDPWYTRGGWRFVAVELPLFMAAWLATYCYIVPVGRDPAAATWIPRTTAVYVGLWLVGLLICSILEQDAEPEPTSWRDRARRRALAVKRNTEALFRKGLWWCIKFLFWAVLAGAIGGLLLYAAVSLFGEVEEANRRWVGSVFGPPVAISCVLLVIVVHIGLMGRGFSDQDRELWSRFGGRFIGLLLAWIVVFGIALYGPTILEWMKNWVLELGIGWFASTLFGVQAGRSAATDGEKSKPWLELATRVAPYVFIVGLLLGLSFAVHVGLQKAAVSWLGAAAAGKCDPSAREGIYLHARANLGASVVTVKSIDDPGELKKFIALARCKSAVMNNWNSPAGVPLLLAVLLALALLAYLASLRININIFSLHHFYHNRLARCYLGATNRSRRPHPVTGFDTRDDVPLADLKQKPLHILGTAINLNRGKQLAWQNRRAASFAFTPLHVGYEPASHHVTGGYRRTSDYGVLDRESIHLGTVVAVSGAAASPNQGFHTSPAVAFLLTVFNVRLGRWCGDTRHQNAWRRRDPKNSLCYWWAELSGGADQGYPFVSLSDGGHFENLGLYELVRRKCAVIVVSDAGADKDYVFDDLADAIRKCYTDFGVRISIDVDLIRPRETLKTSIRHYAVGSIEYADGSAGTLIYWKSSLVDGMPPDIQNYKLANADFPHQTTADQWFDESQFESYRKLGYLVAKGSIDGMLNAGTLPVALG